MNRRISWLTTAVALLVGAGCGPEVVGGGEHGTVHTTMSDETDAGQASRDLSPLPARNTADAGPVAQQVIELEGAVTVEVAAELVTASGGSIDLTEGTVLRTVAIGSSTPATLGRNERVDVGVYPGVRLTFRRVEASLAAGGPLPLEVEVGIGGEPLIVEVPLEVVVRDEEVTGINVDLNAPVWLVLADPVTGIVARSAFASAITVTTQAELAN